MNYRVFIQVIVVLAVFTAVPWAQDDGLGLEQLWRRGQFDAARELIDAHLLAEDATLSFLSEAAGCAKEMRDYQTAAELYSQLATATASTDPDTYQQARLSEWWCRVQTSGPEGMWVADAHAEVAQRLEESSGIARAARRMALEMEYELAQLLGEVGKPSRELREFHPSSTSVLKAAKEAIDEILIEGNEQKRLTLIERFLEDYPDNYWRHTAYRSQLYSLWRLGNDIKLRAAAEVYLEEYRNEPETHGAISRYFFDADIEPEAGLASARRSMELYETALGLDGSAETLARVNAETRDLPPAPDYQPFSRRRQFIDYLGSRYNLARYLVAEENHAEALALMEPLITLAPFTTEEEHTSAQFYLIAGQAAEGMLKYEDAYRYYLGALLVGDTRNRYALPAADSLDEVGEKLSPAEQEQIHREYVPPELAQVLLPTFSDVTSAAGLDNYKYRRVAWGDVDNDGDPDLLLNGRVLLLNDGSRGFTDASKAWGLGGNTVGGLFADMENDGDLDIYAIGWGESGDRLWRNDNGHFVDFTALAGEARDVYPSEGAAWLDYDNDGFIDLYVANYERHVSETGGERGIGTPDRLYHNVSGRRFELVNMAAAGLAPPFDEDCAGRGVCAADYDGDGDQDIYVTNYRLQENFLWRNEGNGTFTNIARFAGVAGYSVDGWWGHSIGADWGDVDNDGDLDLFCANLAHPRYEYFSDKSQLYINEPGPEGPEFSDEREQWGIRFEETHSDPLFFDCNNDGYLDLYITSTYPSRRSFLYLSDGQGGFHDVTQLAGARVFDGWGCAWADYDGDGDLDLAIGSPDGVRLLRNDTVGRAGAGDYAWLEVQCIGAGGQVATGSGATDTLGYSNAAGIGTRVTLTCSRGVLIREIQSGKGTTSGNQLLAHFGLGLVEGRIAVVAQFPSGRTATRALMDANQLIVLHEVPVEQAAEAEPEAADVPEVEEETPEETSPELERPKETRPG